MKITRRQLRQIIREQLGGSAVELTDPAVNAAQVSSAWPDGVTYDGEKVFDIFYNGRAQDDAWSLLRDEGYGEGQEAYLGYSPSADVFVMGFDAWLDEIDDPYDDYDEDGDPDGTTEIMDGVAVEMGPGGDALGILVAQPGGMYPIGLKNIKKRYPDIIDVRLD